MIETKEKVIDGTRYMVTMFPARRALKIKAKLIKLLAPAITAASSGVKGNVLDGDIDSKMLTTAVELLVNSLHEDEFVNLVLEILVCTRRDGKELTEAQFDLAFAGNFGELYKAILFTLEVNFSSFFSTLNIGSLLQRQE